MKPKLVLVVIVLLTLSLLTAASLAQERALDETIQETTTGEVTTGESAKEAPAAETPAAETPAAETPAAEKTIFDVLGSYQLTFIVFLAILACLLCIYGVLFWGRQIQEQSALRGILVDGMKDQEYDKLYEKLYAKAVGGPLDAEKHPPPPGYDNNRLYGIHPKSSKNAASELLTRSSPESNDPPYYITDKGEDAIKKWKDEQKRIRDQENEFVNWEIQEKLRFELETRKIDQTARDQAEKTVPKSMDISLLGGGFSFILEFSTVIVIIFTLLILGIIGSLGGNEISTILASIAGYVLGKATSAQSKEKVPA